MRAIKYRAWHKEKQMLVRVIGISFKEEHVRLPIESEPSDEYWWHETDWDFDGVELMQFTGLKDKNGVDVYVGDIVQADGEYGDGLTGEIYFKNGCFMLRDHALYQIYNVEVIGNIFENQGISR